MKKGTPPFVERTSLRKGLCQVQGRYWGKWGVCEEVNAKRLKKNKKQKTKQNKKKVTRALKIFKGDNKAAQTLPDPNLGVRALIILYILNV